IREEKLRERSAEEMRVLYLARTRAKEKLVMVANVTGFEKKREKWERMLDYSDWVLPAYYRAKARSYLDWVGPALISHQDNAVLRAEEGTESGSVKVKTDPSAWHVSVVHGSTLTNLEEATAEADKELQENIIDWQPMPLEDQQLETLVDERLSYAYSFQAAANSRAKQTVTEIKRQREMKDEY